MEPTVTYRHENGTDRIVSDKLPVYESRESAEQNNNCQAIEGLKS